MQSNTALRKSPFLLGVFLITSSLLTLQIVQTRILSVLAWFYLAFFAISVAMLGMTVGAVWVYLRRDKFEQVPLAKTLADFSLYTAFAMPLSVIVQFCLITEMSLSMTMVFAWALLMAAMAAPYVLSGVVVSLALTRSPFPRGQVYGVDLAGAAVGCFVVVLLLNFVDGPTAVIAAGVVAALASAAFASSGSTDQAAATPSRSWWKRPVPVALALAVLALLNSALPVGIRPMLVKGSFEQSGFGKYEQWNAYSRIVATRPFAAPPQMWGASATLPPGIKPQQAYLNIDGSAGTSMFHYDGTRESISFLQYDLVTLAYRLPGIRKSAVIGVGGGRDIMSAYLFGVPDITGVELNPIFVKLLTRDPFYKNFSNLNAIPGVTLHVDDARSWFASTHQKFDLVQMSMIDTWAATGAGAFSLSENGLYTLEGWHAFLDSLTEDGVFTVSRWYTPGAIDETARLIGLATAALHDQGVRDVRPYMFVASADNIATLVLSKKPFTAQQLDILESTVRQLGFNVLLAPGQPPPSAMLQEVIASQDRAELDRALNGSAMDVAVPTDNRPFFFQQLRFRAVPALLWQFLHHRTPANGVLVGNLMASIALVLILVLAVIAVVCTVLLPLRNAVGESSFGLVLWGTLYFSLIGAGFMMAEMALLQRFSLYLGHPIYSLSVCLASLIFASGMGSIVSDRFRLDTQARIVGWGLILIGVLLALTAGLPTIFAATTGQERWVRILVALAVLMPAGFLMGFAFPTGMRLVEAIDDRPTPWFWGINGATGVLASVISVVISMGMGINVTLMLSALCYLLLLPAALVLRRTGQPAMAS